MNLALFFSNQDMWIIKSEKVGLKLNILKTKIMASGPITSWQIDEETVETMAEFGREVQKSRSQAVAT